MISTFFVAHELHVGNNWPWGTALGGAKVQVHRDVAAQARAIERACIAGDYHREIDEQFGQPEERCPHCGAANFKTRPTIPQMLKVMALFLFVVCPAQQTMRLCRVCGTGWLRQLPD